MAHQGVRVSALLSVRSSSLSVHPFACPSVLRSGASSVFPFVLPMLRPSIRCSVRPSACPYFLTLVLPSTCPSVFLLVSRTFPLLVRSSAFLPSVLLPVRLSYQRPSYIQAASVRAIFPSNFPFTAVASAVGVVGMPESVVGDGGSFAVEDIMPAVGTEDGVVEIARRRRVEEGAAHARRTTARGRRRGQVHAESKSSLVIHF